MRATNLLLGAVVLVAVGVAADGANLGATTGDPYVVGAQTVQATEAPPEAAATGISEEPASLPLTRTATSPMPEGRARQPFGYAGADGEVDDPARSPGAGMSIDTGPDDPAEPAIMSPEGFAIVPGATEAGSGPIVAYTVEVEPSLGIDPLSVAAAVEGALHDPRSWSDEATLRRVDDIAAAAIRVVLAEPATVDELCGQAGLDTGGRFSCWNGTFAALNAMRWEEGAPDFDDLTTYRRYLVNHEFGHGLGYGHEDCEAPGELAPVMMQQTKGTGGCEANGWPYPELSPP